ncbi:Gfo/Idh/MocA family oxidoreductase [Niallia taxi]|mgnify:CR=1 FL=1|uniref:Gfo/Idh/MocA family protein n=1 Tax=Niallia taxi TaxID=2499688 RepID=UPI0021A39358|nr:Gfo/Idh/MocA family oxidoreductase [Niallia taxi]MCT2342868.1 Gfo/Idh/MocA family oxidoreductase [Niallia taxi]MDE5051122.1 Gfo/Idh/MocA family oxidoreductase [Niallia taxi]MED3962550.1 Gfo/Idh/MocA family oxidoreductase [Niallia taxi]WOD62425.1 Gfo/Idh/MocA family oxidoreductase [Niallia taxi]
MKQLNWAILGPGSIAADFAKALNDIHGSIYAVGSRTLEKAEQFAEQFNIQKAYGNYDEMLQDDSIDVVYIATPHSNHYEYIMKSLENNKHVFCEKAITVSSEQLLDAVKLAQEKQLVLAEAMTIYHMPLYKKLREIVSSGKIGKLKMVNVLFGSSKEDDPTNRYFNMELAGGALLDIGTYALSFARSFLTSQPDEILTTVKKYTTGVDEQSGIILKNKDEEMAVVTLAMRARTQKLGIIAGDNGHIIVPDFPRANIATIHYLDGTQETVEAGETAKALHYEIEDIERFIADQDQASTLPLSIDVMEIMTDVRKQWGISYPFE